MSEAFNGQASRPYSKTHYIHCLRVKKTAPFYYRAAWSSDENSVCLFDRPFVRPSVRPSVTRVNCDKTVESSVQIFIPYERSFSLVLREEEWLVGATHST